MNMKKCSVSFVLCSLSLSQSSSAQSFREVNLLPDEVVFGCADPRSVMDEELCAEAVQVAYYAPAPFQPDLIGPEDFITKIVVKNLSDKTMIFLPGMEGHAKDLPKDVIPEGVKLEDLVLAPGKSIVLEYPKTRRKFFLLDYTPEDENVRKSEIRLVESPLRSRSVLNLVFVKATDRLVERERTLKQKSVAE